MHPLDGARLKVVRAQEHVNALKAEIRAYLDDKPYEIVVQKHSNGWSTFPRIKSTPPLHISLVIGDCLNNLRASLDHIVWQLALKYFDKPLINPAKDKRWVSFPIYQDIRNNGYLNKINRLLNRQVPAKVIDAIQTVQPHDSRYEALWWLNELVNEDKHRLVLLTIGHIQSVNSMTLTTPLGTVHEVGGDGEVSIFGPAESAESAGDVKVQSQATVFIAFRDSAMPREPVNRTLEQIVECVANVIPRFDQFF